MCIDVFPKADRSKYYTYSGPLLSILFVIILLGVIGFYAYLELQASNKELEKTK